jgi:hypothetical protein
MSSSCSRLSSTKIHNRNEDDGRRSHQRESPQGTRLRPRWLYERQPTNQPSKDSIYELPSAPVHPLNCPLVRHGSISALQQPPSTPVDSQTRPRLERAAGAKKQSHIHSMMGKSQAALHLADGSSRRATKTHLDERGNCGGSVCRRRSGVSTNGI